MIKALLGGLAATALLAAPVAHAASPARASAPVGSANEMGGGDGSFAPWIMALIIVGGIIWAISETDVDSPDSP
ncbi:MAG: hypothetical protein Q8R44_16315 [Novosphingobium sp.]|nr:hypothetical protein [Novosphingobium sp.]